MLHSLQCIGWSVLDPTPIPLQGPVVALLGQNGSGKSSFMDAAKALLGARRFGSGRTASSYRFAGRGGEAPQQRAYVLGVFHHEGRLPKTQSPATALMEVSASRRRYALLEGEVILRPEHLADDLQELLEQLPASRWMRPAQWQERVLDKLGFGPALRRLLELPQGEIARAMDRNPQQLLELLIELSGGAAATDRFQRAHEAVSSARRSQAEARRRIDRGRAELAEAQLKAGEAERARMRRAQLARLLNPAEELLTEAEAEAAEIAEAAREARRAAAQARARRRRPFLAPGRLAKEGIQLQLSDGVWALREQDVERARELLGPGEVLPVSGSPAIAELVRGPEPAAEAEAEQELPEPEISPAQLRRLRALVANLKAAGIAAADGAHEPGREPGQSGAERPERRSVAELLGAFDALSEGGIPTQAAGKGVDLDSLRTRLESDREELERRDLILKQAAERLGEAEQLYERSVREVLGAAAERFQMLCERAGLRGRMELSNRSGAVREVMIFAGEEAREEMRPLHGAQASLSGGWRATVVVLAILACLSAEQAPPLLLLDEVAASLDEERMQALGQAFAALGRGEGLTTIITVPSKNVSQTVAGFASQQVAFFRPAPEDALAPPPHIVMARSAALRPVA